VARISKTKPGGQSTLATTRLLFPLSLFAPSLVRMKSNGASTFLDPRAMFVKVKEYQWFGKVFGY
jgi:hypothetical protein